MRYKGFCQRIIRMDVETKEKGNESVDSNNDIKINKEYIEIRKEKLFNFFKKSQLWVLILLIIALLLGIYIRSLPMADHTQRIPSFTSFILNPVDFYNGKPGLWDITTNTWTLGPDLDPWLFLRNAKTIVEQGNLPDIDYMRNVPLGFDNSIESKLLAYMIAWTYKILKIFDKEVNIEFAGVVFPVIMFALTIITFFLFVREVFLDKSKESVMKANIIAIISSFFMIVTPIFLSRTVAGIPEKEAAAFFFMFLAFYLFLKAWKIENIKASVMLAILSGISTGLMGLVWGGVIYLFIPIGIAGLLAFILNKIHKKEFLVYLLWVAFSFGIMMYFSRKYGIIEMFTSLSSGVAFFSVFVMIVHFLISRTKISETELYKKSKLPPTIISLIISIIILAVLTTILLKPSFIVEKIKAVHQTLFKPVIGRWNITVAENKQPNFLEWSQSFGPFFNNVPIFFWLFFIGSVVLLKKSLNAIKKKDAWTLTLMYVLFLLGLIFSRYSGSSIFNGDNLISKAFYYIASLLFLGFIIKVYIKYHKNNDKSFENINFEFIVLLCLFVFTLFTVRGAVRLIMSLGPIAPILVGFLIVESIEKFSKAKDNLMKMIIGVIVIIILISSVYCYWAYYNSIKAQSYSFIPSSYNVQWQKAMEWVRLNTNENAVFAHWWDYGYWIQSIGNRATVTDGGNAIVYWNYLSGRLVLTGDNEKDALDFLYSHNTTHLLIDSTDIGKYTAFSSIGSDKDYDRYSWISPFLLDERQTQETKNTTIYVYGGGLGLDEDLIINESGKQFLLPRERAAVAALILPVNNIDDTKKGFQQPYIVLIYQNQQYKVNIRYVSVNRDLFDFGNGIEAAIYIFPRLDQTGQGLAQNPIGAAMYISPRLFRGMLAQIYILGDPLNKFPNINLVHSEDSLIVDDLKNQGLQLNDFVYFNGIHGPIKIWEINYTGKEEFKQEYVDTNYRKYIDWLL